jgi:hypothetical protein
VSTVAIVVATALFWPQIEKAWKERLDRRWTEQYLDAYRDGQFKKSLEIMQRAAADGHPITDKMVSEELARQFERLPQAEKKQWREAAEKLKEMTDLPHRMETLRRTIDEQNARTQDTTLVR